MYKLGQKDLITNEPMCIIRFNNDGSVTSFGFDEANTDYQAYLKWVAEGNLPRPADFVEPSSESSVTPLPAEGTE